MSEAPLDDEATDPPRTEEVSSDPGPTPVDIAPESSREPRPLVERIGLACIALAIGAMFGGVGYAAWLGGEWFLAIIGAISWVMTWWVGILTLVRS